MAPKRIKGTRSSLARGPVDAEGLQVTEDAMAGQESRQKKVYPVSDADVEILKSSKDNSQNTTRVLADGMGKDGSAELKKWLKSKE